MKEKKTLSLSVPLPCSENWDKMTPLEKGRHCNNCNKTILDFSFYSDKELIDFFNNAKGTICGRVSNSQLNRAIVYTEQNNPLFLQRLFVGTALAVSISACNQVADNSNNLVQQEQQVQSKAGSDENTEQDQKQQDANTNFISGTVLDEQGTPLNGVDVLFVKTGHVTKTNKQGYFKIKLDYSLIGKELTLSFTAPNYQTVTKKFIPNKLPYHCDLITMYPMSYHTTGIIAVPPYTVHSNDTVYTFAQVMPKFQGDMQKYLSDKVDYPKEMQDEKVEGTVYVTFIVEKDGRTSNVKLLRGLRPQLDSASLQAIRAMPAWTPGTQNGHAVRVQYNLPIRFKLPDNSSDNKVTN